MIGRPDLVNISFSMRNCLLILFNYQFFTSLFSLINCFAYKIIRSASCSDLNCSKKV